MQRIEGVTPNYSLSCRTWREEMRRMEAHPKDWVCYGFDKVADIPLPLRKWCVEYDGSSPYFKPWPESSDSTGDGGADDDFLWRVDDNPVKNPPDTLFQ
uniref:Uncharacterized protein At2g06230 n=2 Tax=Arabidopsis thaliana TaxID=3702 RepID=Q9SJS3_ARATH|nr:hypothetical protein [Arabidopsis thaliana]AAM15238.1 hypothetical protein [Arabidopsis thaliana]